MTTKSALIDPGTPHLRERLSVEQEASLMNRGRPRQVLFLVGGALLLAVGGAVVLQRVARGDAYAGAAAATARIEREHFDAFFACALPDTRPSERSEPQLQASLGKVGARLGKGYSKQLDACLPHVQALDESVRALEVPKTVKTEHGMLVAAASTLTAANADYLRYLGTGGESYDIGKAAPLIQRFGAAWAGYRAAQVDLERALEQRM
jgi:hypothetical protein